jgi:hypothetical protein
MAHGKMREGRKAKKAVDRKQKTGDQRNATASDKVRSTASGIRVTLQHDEAWGNEERLEATTVSCPSASPCSPLFPMVTEVSLQDVVS